MADFVPFNCRLETSSQRHNTTFRALVQSCPSRIGLGRPNLDFRDACRKPPQCKSIATKRPGVVSIGQARLTGRKGLANAWQPDCVAFWISIVRDQRDPMALWRHAAGDRPTAFLKDLLNAASDS